MCTVITKVMGKMALAIPRHLLAADCTVHAQEPADYSGSSKSPPSDQRHPQTVNRVPRFGLG